MDRNATLVAEQDAPATTQTVESDVLDEVLLEEISIDGMCGVY